ncbi:MAG: aminopeptidase N [Proteobacteria bacterium]|nr:aminopeptidase N [Pseudomonadota bacterium]
MSTQPPKTIYLKDYQNPSYLIDSTELFFDLMALETLVTAKSQFRVNPLGQNPRSHELELEGDSLELISVVLNKKALNAHEYGVTPEKLVIFNVPEQFELEIKTRIKPHENTTLNGLYQSNEIFCTQCEAHGFRRITYFLDRPDVLARYKTTIAADKKKYPILLSNGNLIGSGGLTEGRHWVSWEDPYPKPSYLFALVAGNLLCIEDTFVTCSKRTVTLQIYVEKGNETKCQHALSALKKAMAWDEQFYKREYDLDIYMILAINDFNMGAMENKGLNIFNSKYVLADPDSATDVDYQNIDTVIAHEYFHNWTGNRVTCRDWFQLSLKEGLTVFREQQFAQTIYSSAVKRIEEIGLLRTNQFREDAGPMAHPVRPDSYIEVNNFYTSTVYNKGAEVIRMMFTLLGAEVFYRGMDCYFQRHDGKAVTIEDFIRAMEDTSQVDLSQFRYWYSQSGTPRIKISTHYDKETEDYEMTIQQSCPPTPNQEFKQPFHIPILIGLLDVHGKDIVFEKDFATRYTSTTALLELKAPEQVYYLGKFSSKPTLSYLREFSAPVIVETDHKVEELMFLYRHDNNGFVRWEAGQSIFSKLFLKLIRDHQMGERLYLPDEYIELHRIVLKDHTIDNELKAELLTLPETDYIAEQLEVIDIDAICAVKSFIRNELSLHLRSIYLDIYSQCQTDKAYSYNTESVGKRRMKNLVLSYLLQKEDESSLELCRNQFDKADNMTEKMGALRAITHKDTPIRNQVLNAFYESWKHDALVMDKWFSVQAISELPDTLKQVKSLMENPTFNIKNPNKVRSLIGAFCFQNPLRFHDISGEGYRFLTEVVLKVDVLNPQNAARLVNPLIQWKRMDPKRQQLMKTQLELILKSKPLSKDVYEIVEKGLKG